MARPRNRRQFLATFGVSAAGLAVGCGGATRIEPQASVVTGSRHESAAPTLSPTATSIPTATPTSTPVPTPTPRPAGLETRLLMAGSEWETPVTIRSSGLDGPTLVILGGVHGNEPGGWFAADNISTWEPVAGAVAVLPRANLKAISGFLRLVDGEGDLNRGYPGDPNSELPTERLCAEITALAAELQAEVLMDLHESWSFYVDREAVGFVNREVNGTAFLGQTITGGIGPMTDIATRLGEAVNPAIDNEREHFIIRDGRGLGRNDAPGPNNRGRSSLSLGGHVAGLTPILVETGQEGLSVDRRTELHLQVVRAAMDLLAI